MTSSGVLLDTCAVLWLANGDPMRAEAREALVEAGLGGGVFVSLVSAWEIGMLSAPRGSRPALQFLPDPRTWFGRVMRGPGIKLAPFTPEMALGASDLPGELCGDMADRLLISTARHLGMPIVTRDARIAAYAAQGLVAIVPC